MIFNAEGEYKPVDDAENIDVQVTELLPEVCLSFVVALSLRGFILAVPNFGENAFFFLITCARVIVSSSFAAACGEGRTFVFTVGRDNALVLPYFADYDGGRSMKFP